MFLREFLNFDFYLLIVSVNFVKCEFASRLSVMFLDFAFFLLGRFVLPHPDYESVEEESGPHVMLDLIGCPLVTDKDTWRLLSTSDFLPPIINFLTFYFSFI